MSQYSPIEASPLTSRASDSRAWITMILEKLTHRDLLIRHRLPGLDSEAGLHMHFTKLVIAAIALIAVTGGVSSPAQSPKGLTFEVASVKVNKSIDSQNPQLVMRSMTLQYLPGGR